MQNNPQISQMDSDFPSKDGQTYAIIGAAMAVHSELGAGFLEAVYHDAKALLLNFGARSLQQKRIVFNLRESADNFDENS